MFDVVGSDSGLSQILTLYFDKQKKETEHNDAASFLFMKHSG